ncbi:hypothetical protein R6U48_22420 [Pseudomonas aeruginosa]|nr:hypothetical protein [Pseudomonas aeruginosa]WRH44346.1 hypothetical protein R6U48_22420 [Pseudomonas aeruginosa]
MLASFSPLGPSLVASCREPSCSTSLASGGMLSVITCQPAGQSTSG